MISDLESYIEAELNLFKILLGILRTALRRLSELITSQRASRNTRCILLFTTLIYQILELLEAFPSLVVDEISRQRDRALAGSHFGIRLGEFAIDTEEQSVFRTQAILKKVNQGTEVLRKLRALSTGSASSVNSSNLGDFDSRSDQYFDLELRFNQLAARLQKR